MHDWLRMVFDFLSVPSESRALLLAIFGGMMFTQWFKFQLPATLPDDDHARTVRTVSSIIGAFLCLALWPRHPHASAYAMAFISGISTPTAYWLMVRVLYHYVPWAEDVLSARPGAHPT
jgi:hypothetical protein